MLEKMNQLAEDAATNVSRRGFLRQFGKGAAALVVVMGSALAFPSETEAGRGDRGGRCPSRCHRVKGECICPRRV